MKATPVDSKSSPFDGGRADLYRDSPMYIKTDHIFLVTGSTYIR